jgi:para-nitrobenzyl esterase
MRHLERRKFIQLGTAAALSSGIASATVHADDVYTIVETSAGRVRGRVRDGIATFLGVPYGRDTRLTRFQPPLPPEPWKDVRDAFVYGDRAPQMGRRSGRIDTGAKRSETFHLPPDEGAESEDCLHLNIWAPTPLPARTSHRPVLVYFHGGAFNAGTVNCALYDGTRLCHRGDVVVVTVNHRLNAFGFLYLANTTNDPAYADSGNVGMLDLVLALKWVRENIAVFGGDPTRVTTFGQSGGGAKCATMMAIPKAHGLFHRVMSMSGQQVTAASRSIAAERTKQFLANTGVAEVPPDKLRAALDSLPLETLKEAAAISSAWLPVVDGRTLPRDPFSPDAPSLSESVPMILGNTHDETRGLIGTSQPALFSLTWEELPAALKKNVGVFLGSVSPETVVSRYREWYPEYSPSDVFFAAATAFRSWPGQVIEAERRAESPAQQRTWVYQMNWSSPVAGGKFGAPHTIDIPFFFDNLALAPGMIGEGSGPVSAAQPLADAMSESLLAFARAGDPNHPGQPPWQSYDLRQRTTMIWKLRPTVENDPRQKERELAAMAHYRQPGT